MGKDQVDKKHQEKDSTKTQDDTKMSNPCRICGRKVKRTEMTEKQLQCSIKWCKAEITKLEKELAAR